MPVDQIGTYSWDVEITAPFASPESNERFLLKQLQGTYDVIEVFPFTFDFIQPNQDVIPLHGRGLDAWNVQPVEISARLKDLDGAPLSGKDVFASPVDESVVVVVTQVDTDQSHVYSFPFSSYDDSLMSTTIMPEDFDIEGEYLFRIEMVGVPNRLVYRMAPIDVTTSLFRENTFLTSKSTYLFSGGTILFIMLIGVAFLVYLYTKPIKGELCFSSALSSEPFDVINMTSNKKRFVKIGKKRISKITSVIISSFLREMKISKNSDGTLNLIAHMDRAVEGEVQRKRIRNLGSELHYFVPGKGIFVCYNGLLDEEQSEELIEVVSDNQKELIEKVSDDDIDLVEDMSDNQEELIEEVPDIYEDLIIEVADHQEDLIEEVADDWEDYE